ncbi:hypothetical protein QBC38DRAFT_76609 [Podospora fimiseda]|uniref:Uncharacterized protein n=1 Tax=Podospora fimiseda TaxID=252190 RepID=A0AAN7BUV4_9PEZI|nr:hypothetical protein QBC38DRAFT_76609 [Podospora fimiseda]
MSFFVVTYVLVLCLKFIHRACYVYRYFVLCATRISILIHSTREMMMMMLKFEACLRQGAERNDQNTRSQKGML